MENDTLDALDRKIVAALARDGRCSYREIARALDVSEGTVRGRVARLQEAGLIRVTVVGSPLLLGVDVVAIVMIRVKPGMVRETAEILSRLPNVRFVGTSFGSTDIIIQTLHGNVRDLHRFVSEKIPSLAPAVTSTETFQLADVLKSTWTWGDWYEYVEGTPADDEADVKLAASS
jgi:Lrp/AsnC family transcriptional regulator, regulator for asnA, asnC and gidA